MKILFCHNFYQQAGGEDVVYKSEIAVLREAGFDIVEYHMKNSSISNLWKKALLVFGAAFNPIEFVRLVQVLKKEKPDLVHVHNYFPLMSPSVFYACNLCNIPVVHTLHNYRAVCPTATLMFEGRVEERSLVRSSWWALRKRVYRDSFWGTFALCFLIQVHKNVGTWRYRVTRFIALTEFAKQKYGHAGWPVDKISVKPNFISDPYSKNEEISKKGGYFVFVGRLSEEKGIDKLIRCWSEDFPLLKIIGDGPLEREVRDSIQANIQYLGRLEKPRILSLVRDADFLIMPSIWYEGFPMVLVEAFASGTAALVSKLGSMEEIVTHKVTGMHFNPFDTRDLAQKVEWIMSNPDESIEMGKRARQEYIRKYAPERNLELLNSIYCQALSEGRINE